MIVTFRRRIGYLPLMADGPKVKRYAQPLGNAGIAHSLDMVSRKAIEGGRDEVVRAWATHVLKACGFPKGALARARCFLADTRLYPWIPDPVDVEFIPSPRSMMPNVLTGEGPIYLADDCDGLTARWLALCLAAGIRAQVVGYSFDDDDKIITHVLGSVWDDVAKEWVDGDPSFQDIPLGKTQPHTWEQRRDLPSMEITCDDTACDLKKAPNELEGVVDFVGVGKPGPSTVGFPGEVKTGDDSSWLPNLGDELQSLANHVTESWKTFKETYDGMRAVFAAGGLVEVSQLASHGWTADDQQNAIELGVMATVSAKYLNEAASGVRAIWPSPVDTEAMKGLHDNLKTRCMATGGKFDDALYDAAISAGVSIDGKEADLCACPGGTGFKFYDGCVPPGYVSGDVSWAVETKPGDVYGIDLVNGKPVLVNAQGDPTHPKPSNAVGTPAAVAPLAAAAAPIVATPVIATTPVLVAGAVVLVVAIYAVIKYIENYTNLARTAATVYVDSQATKCREKDSGVPPDECEKRIKEQRDWWLKANPPPAPPVPVGDPVSGLVSLVNAVVFGGGAILTIYGLVTLAQTLSAKKKAAS